MILTEFPNLTLATGRTIFACEVYITGTYAGLLEGVPDDALNQRLLSATPRCLARIFRDVPIFVLPPEIERRPEPHPLGGDRQIAMMPPNEFAVRFMSFETISSKGDGSHLVVVWHQHLITPIISDSTRTRLEHLNWDEIAQDFCW